MKSIQDIINSAGNNIELPSGEFKGPVIIDRPCTVKGNSTTLWNNDGSVIEIRSAGVKLCNIRAEITSSNADLCCICSYYQDTLFENMEISGRVKGIKNEEFQWIMPKSISLGDFKSDSRNTYQMEIYVPAECELLCDISGIKISPLNLKKGRNTVFIEADDIKNNVFIYGEILIKSLFTRRIYISGRSYSDAELRNNIVLYKAEEPNPEKNTATDFSAVRIPQREIMPSGQRSKPPSIQRLRKGERIYIDDIANDLIKIEFNCRKILAPMDIDPYVFLTDANNKVVEDENFVFFSNPVSADRSVRIQQGKNKVSDVEIDLNIISPYIEKISVAYSIYARSSRDNFSKVNEPFITVRSRDSIKYLFSAENLIMETTVIFLEIYRRGNSWKMSMVGAGYKNGLSTLCESYGLKVGY